MPKCLNALIIGLNPFFKKEYSLSKTTWKKRSLINPDPAIELKIRALEALYDEIEPSNQAALNLKPSNQRLAFYTRSKKHEKIHAVDYTDDLEMGGALSAISEDSAEDNDVDAVRAFR